MNDVKKGIAVVGTVLVDKINEIAAYPNAGALEKIVNVSKAAGGLVPNVGLDLKKICPDLPVWAVGKVGNDDNGTFLKELLAEGGLDTAYLQTIPDGITSFTEVMSVKGGQRTFFTFAGADGTLTADELDFSQLQPKILHLGYFLLLDKIDGGEGVKILQKALDAGIETSIDLVSENSDRYSLVLPCLPYTDYLIINELEAERLAGVKAGEKPLTAVAQMLKDKGVRKKVIIHKPDCSICCSDAGVSVLGSYAIPKDYIKGTTGAGDAFCAGALFGIYNDWDDMEIMAFASGSAVMALGAADATSGLCEQKQIEEFCKQFGRNEPCL